MINPKFKEGQKVVTLYMLSDTKDFKPLTISEIKTNSKNGEVKISYLFTDKYMNEKDENLIISLDDVPKMLLEIQQEKIKKILETGLEVLQKLEKIKQEEKQNGTSK